MAIRLAMKTNFRNFPEIKNVTPLTDAPSTFRMLISLVRRSRVYTVKPKSPIHEMITDNMTNALKTLPLVKSCK